MSGRPMQGPVPRATEGRGRPASGLVVFFGLTLALTAAAWGPAAVTGRDPGLVLLAVGGAAPSVVAVVMIRRWTRAARRDFWLRVVDPRRIPLTWWVLLVLLFPATMAASLGLVAAMGGRLPTAEMLMDTATSPARLALVVGTTLIGGPLSEELGWRGFALSRLQHYTGPLAASLLLGGVGAVWHLPLFFMSGMVHSELGLATPHFWGWLGTWLAFSVIVTWVYNHSHGSILGAVLLHFMLNLTVVLLVGTGLESQTLPVEVSAAWAVLNLAAAFALVATVRPQNDTAHRSPP